MRDKTQELRRYLKQMADARHTLGVRRPEGFAYDCLEHLIYEHGQEFTPVPLLTKYRREPWEPKHCYWNTAQLVRKYPDELEYCEGYAVSKLGVPMLHAWAVRKKDGRVVDVTWRWRKDADWHKPEDGAMLGLIFPVQKVIARMDDDDTGFAMLEDWMNRYPVLQQPWDIYTGAQAVAGA